MIRYIREALKSESDDASDPDKSEEKGRTYLRDLMSSA